MTIPRACGCIRCSLDVDAGLPMATAQWSDTGLFWTGYRGSGDVWGVLAREDAAAFGPRHADVLRRSPAFTVAVLPAAEAARVRVVEMARRGSS